MTIKRILIQTKDIIALLILTFFMISAYIFAGIRIVLSSLCTYLIIMIAIPFFLVAFLLNPSMTISSVNQLKKLEFEELKRKKKMH